MERVTSSSHRAASRKSCPRTDLRVEPLEVRTLPTAVLVFTETAGFRHDSIPDAVAAVQQLGAENGFQVDQSEDPTVFTDANLARYDAVLFLLTTGDFLDTDQEAAFQRYIEAGHGWVGVHSAADTGYTWPWYGQLMGAYFQDHPDIQQATIDILDPNFPSTAGLPKHWVRTDEWYNFQYNPRINGVTVLANLDESTYQGGTMGADHPIMWYHDFDGGRAWYTAGGHTSESYSEPLFLQSLLGGIEYAIGNPLFLSARGKTGEIRLDWADLGTGATGYRIERSTDDAQFTPLASVPATQTKFLDTDVDAATEYYYRIIALTDQGDGPASNTAQAMTRSHGQSDVLQRPPAKRGTSADSACDCCCCCEIPAVANSNELAKFMDAAYAWALYVIDDPDAAKVGRDHGAAGA